MSYQESAQQTDLMRTLLQVFDAWDVAAGDQVRLLGLADDIHPRVLSRFRAGMEFPEAPDFLQRAHLLLSIKRAIDSVHPHSQTAADYWVTTGCWTFNDVTPLQVMLDDGLAGMEAVLNALNGQGR